MADNVFSQGFQLRAMLERSEARAEPAAPLAAPSPPQAPEALSEESDPLPSPGDPYRAHGRISNKPELMLGLVRGAHSLPEIFAYADLRRITMLPPTAPGGGPPLVLRILEAELIEVICEGRNLMFLPDYLRQHRIAWLRELPQGRQVSDPQAVVITRMTVKAVEEQSGD